jgi:purine-binding chemotaxis protein CheW
LASTEPTTADNQPAFGGNPAERTLLFRAGGRTFGCSIDAVREIIPQRRPTRIPGAPPPVLGLINLRGTIVTVIDLALWLGADRPTAPEGSVILVDHGARVAGEAVDEVLDVQMLTREDAAGTVGDRDGVVRGMGRLGDTVVILVDITGLVRQILV